MKSSIPKLHSVKFKNGGCIKPVNFTKKNNKILNNTGIALERLKEEDCVGVAIIGLTKDGDAFYYYKFQDNEKYGLIGAIEQVKSNILIDN